MPTRVSLANDLRALGLAAGRLVMVHASLRAIGKVEGGPEVVIGAIEDVVGPAGGVLMNLGAKNDWDWVNHEPAPDRAGLLADAEPFDALQTPADPDVGHLAEAFRRMPGTRVTDHPEGRFGARGGARALLEDPPWNDYYGPGSALDRLCGSGGAVLRLGADVDTVTLLHWAEYLAEVPGKRRAHRHRRVLREGRPKIVTIECLDDSDGIVDYPGPDYFGLILADYLALGRASAGRVGGASSELIDAADFAAFGADWMSRRFAAPGGG